MNCHGGFLSNTHTMLVSRCQIVQIASLSRLFPGRVVSWSSSAMVCCHTNVASSGCRKIRFDNLVEERRSDGCRGPPIGSQLFTRRQRLRVLSFLVWRGRQ
jgi:hypothetical protein